jgi:hypothetical protein
MAQTAVKWFIEKTTESGHLWLTDKPYGMDELDLIIQAAKQMEKEQIIEAWMDIDTEFERKCAEQYYNETYGK